MILNAQLPELSSYRRIERTLPLVDAQGFDSLVVANDNEYRPVHRWFRFKESFSADFLKRVLESVHPRARRLTILDPFCGVGTSVLSAQMMGSKHCEISALGIERNPFVAFVAQTKLMWNNIDPIKMESIGSDVLRRAASLKSTIPPLTSLTTGRCMSRHIAKRLLSIRDAAGDLRPGPVQNALLLGIASAIEPLSRVRKDGRALRIIERPRQIVADVVEAKWRDISIDVVLCKQTIDCAGQGRVILGDGRFPSRSGVLPNSVDVVVTSPPYPNNIDYSEVYKLELWLMGFISDAEKFLSLRKQTFRSHPTSDLSSISSTFLDEVKKGKLRTVLSPLLRRTREHQDAWREKLILGYFADLWSSLHEQYECLRKGGMSFVVLGNSLHGASDEPYLIPTDIVAGLIGECAGFELREIGIARGLKRRLSGNHFLRESIVVLRKNA
jgi:hypothetical protein